MVYLFLFAKVNNTSFKHNFLVCFFSNFVSYCRMTIKNEGDGNQPVTSKLWRDAAKYV